MKSYSITGILLIAMLTMAPLALGDTLNLSPTDWPWWRGPNWNGVANPNQAPPIHWSDTTNIQWKSKVPGRSHGSPIIIGDKILMAVAEDDKDIQSILCIDKNTGKELWNTVVHEGGLKPSGRMGNPRSSRASATPSSDGNRVFINFLNNDAVYITALDLDGKQLWQSKLCDYAVHQGYGSSTTVYGPLVLAVGDNKEGGAVAGFNRETGELVWSSPRADKPNYTSPLIMNIDGRDQCVLVGQDLITSLDPLTGEKLWDVEGATTECVTSVVTDGTHVVTSGGYPDNHISVVRANESGETIWRNDVRVYVPSILFKDGHIYGVSDAGEAFCYSMTSDTPLWEKRLRKKFAASPVLIGDTIYATSDDGTTFIFKATTDGYEEIAVTELTAEDVQATPVFSDGKIYMRLAIEEDDSRQEVLYCISAD